MKEFIDYLGSRVFERPDKLFYQEEVYMEALSQTLADVRYHYNDVTEDVLIQRIVNNQNELLVFLYRFGNTIFNIDNASQSLQTIHFLMKDLCSSEIYYSNKIDVGFYIFHGAGTVIGSRNQIGKGFKIYQNCTIGHRSKNAVGNIIKDNVTCYAGVKILGQNEIGSNVVIGANTVVAKSIPANKVVYGNPLVINEVRPATNIV